MKNFDNARQVFLASLFALILMIFASGCGDRTEEITNTDLSNKSIGWGFRKIENGIPEITKEQEELLANGAFWLGDTTESVLYLTFDCGYEAGYTPKILDVLKNEDVRATFFVTGHFIDANPDLIKRMVADGHIIGNHTNKHINMPKSSDEKIKEELDGLKAKYQSVIGEAAEMKFFRPPEGEASARTVKLTKDLGYETVFWSSAYVDWDDKHSGQLDWAFNSVQKQFHNGSIILLHNTSKNNGEILERVIKDAKAKNFVFKNLDEFKGA